MGKMRNENLMISKNLIENYSAQAKIINSSDQNDMIIEYAPLIKHIALRIAVRLPPHIELDDLISAGVIGLIDAVKKFDSTRDIKFKTYAEIRVKGAILDELRSLDWVPRSVRQKATALSKVYLKLEQELGRAATDSEAAKKMGVGIEEFHDILKNSSGIPLISLEDMGGKGADGEKRDILECLAGTKSSDPQLLTSVNEIKNIVIKGIDELPEKERILVSLYYYDELSMKEIGAVMGITESRISQIHTKIILRLKGKLKIFFEE